MRFRRELSIRSSRLGVDGVAYVPICSPANFLALWLLMRFSARQPSQALPLSNWTDYGLLTDKSLAKKPQIRVKMRHEKTHVKIQNRHLPEWIL